MENVQQKAVLVPYRFHHVLGNNKSDYQQKCLLNHALCYAFQSQADKPAKSEKYVIFANARF